MRAILHSPVLGFLAGAVAAVIVGRFFPGGAAQPAHRAAAAPPPREGIVPPGWDPRLLHRLAAVEAKLEERAPQPTPAAPPEAIVEREHAREEQYRNELEVRARTLAEHDAEPAEQPWSEQEAAEIRRVLEPAAAAFAIRAVDCRMTTCVAQITFAAPADAVAAQRSLLQRVPHGVRGVASILTPPTNDGAYDSTVIYYRGP
jgi:hypothetical protein